MTLQQWLPAQDSPEVIVNENFDALGHMAVFAKDATTTAGLTWGYLGGRWGGFAVAAGTLTLPASSTVYITVSRATGAISANTTDANWTNIDLHARVYKLVTGAATVTTIEDYRAGHGGVHGITEAPGGGGSSMAPIVPVSGVSKALTLDDAGTYLRFTAAGGKTLTIDVAAGFAAGQEFHIANRAASGDLTLTPTGVTLNAPKGGALVLEQKDTVTIKFISSTEADVFGSTKGGA